MSACNNRGTCIEHRGADNDRVHRRRPQEESTGSLDRAAESDRGLGNAIHHLPVDESMGFVRNPMICLWWFPILVVVEESTEEVPLPLPDTAILVRGVFAIIVC